MKKLAWLAVPIGIVLAALPSLAGVCDLQCAAAGAKVTQVSVAPSPPEPESCPLHPTGSSASTASPQAPCHGQRDGRVGRVLIASSTVQTLVAPQELPAFEPAAPTPRGKTAAVQLRGGEGRFDRSSPSPSIRSILRV